MFSGEYSWVYEEFLSTFRSGNGGLDNEWEFGLEFWFVLAFWFLKKSSNDAGWLLFPLWAVLPVYLWSPNNVFLLTGSLYFYRSIEKELFFGEGLL